MFIELKMFNMLFEYIRYNIWKNIFWDIFGIIYILQHAGGGEGRRSQGATMRYCSAHFVLCYYVSLCHCVILCVIVWHTLYCAFDNVFIPCVHFTVYILQGAFYSVLVWFPHLPLSNSSFNPGSQNLGNTAASAHDEDLSEKKNMMDRDWLSWFFCFHT